MFRATIPEDNVTYTSKEISDIAEKLYEYVNEFYGRHLVRNARGETIGDCRKVKLPGDYTLHTDMLEGSFTIEEYN